METVNGALMGPASAPIRGGNKRLCALELEDGTVYQGYTFGAQKVAAGELVFQTGMVGYPESITDPSYRGQILVITFPLVGNYGAPSREAVDDLLETLPKHFESNQIHIAGLVVATYAGEDYSHYLAHSSLGQWLEEQGVPGMYGVDTRALTKRIREEGSMLGRMLLQKPEVSGSSLGMTLNAAADRDTWKSYFEQTEWVDPNKKNLVSEGKAHFAGHVPYTPSPLQILTGTPENQCQSESHVFSPLVRASPPSIRPAVLFAFYA